jgi:lipid-binding SYLF domain-containing protein
MQTRISKATRLGLAAVLALAAIGFAGMSRAGSSEENAQLIQEANHTIDVYRKADPGIDAFFRRAVGYAVFPGIGKGGIGIGGAHGTGVLFENGQPVGKVKMNQVTVGAQVGGQSFSQIVFYEVPKTLNELKSNKAEFSAEASAVAVDKGAAAKARFKNGIAIFTATKGGMMFEASVGGQKFDYKPFGSL